MKVSLTERVSIEAGGTVLDEQRFPGRQGRLVFAYLLAVQGRPVPRDELAQALWGDEPPDAASALRVAITRLRRALDPSELHVERRHGGYALIGLDASNTDVIALDDLERRSRDAADASSKSDHLRSALALWTGPALGDLRRIAAGERLAVELDHHRRQLRLALLADVLAQLTRGP